MVAHATTFWGHDTTALAVGSDPWEQHLIDTGVLTAEQLGQAQAFARALDISITDALIRCVHLPQSVLTMAQCDWLNTGLVDPMKDRPDLRLVRTFGPVACLHRKVLPWRQVGGAVVVLAPDPETFAAAKADLTDKLGPVRMGFAVEDKLTAAIAKDFAQLLVDRAETRLDARDSSRSWSARASTVVGLSAMGALIAGLTLAPGTTVTLLCAVAVVMLALSAVLKGAAAIAACRIPTENMTGPDTLPLALPVISLLVPLYREREIADHLITRLEQIDYPRQLLDVCLILEDNDTTTKEALDRTRLLTWMRAITVPKGTLRTKPRALNYALDFTRGSIIGVYDAEDAPDRNQLLVVADRFARAAPNVACLQGVLDYYNSTANWLTRCFTVEYASWFRVVLPGLARMGLVVPLGGTTLFFRRDVLDRVGTWDAHNVTEDADLGIRLARHGYITEFIPTVTLEEANGRFWPWVKQRSRWLKGYAITYAVHMRNPARLWRDLGGVRFFGVQLLFLGTLAQFTLAPVLWSFWLILAGLPHPLADTLPQAGWMALVALFLTSEAINLGIAALGLHRAGKIGLIGWAATLQAYFPLGSMAVYKGLLELCWKPFWWDKTAHGVLLTKDPVTRPGRRPASDG